MRNLFEDIGEWILAISMILFIFGGIGGGIYLIGSQVYSCYNKIDTTIENYNIVSIERGTEISGAFVLGFGGISSHMEYYFYKDLGGGSYILKTSYAENTTIIESNTEKPSYKETQMGCGLYKYTITVPVGTIKKEFKL